MEVEKTKTNRNMEKNMKHRNMETKTKTWRQNKNMEAKQKHGDVEKRKHRKHDFRVVTRRRLKLGITQGGRSGRGWSPHCKKNWDSQREKEKAKLTKDEWVTDLMSWAKRMRDWVIDWWSVGSSDWLIGEKPRTRKEKKRKEKKRIENRANIREGFRTELGRVE
jgi:hypothetical protein